MLGDIAMFMEKPRHKYIKFKCGDPGRRIGFYIGSPMVEVEMGGSDILDTEGFDWEKYKKRMANTND